MIEQNIRKTILALKGGTRKWWKERLKGHKYIWIATLMTYARGTESLTGTRLCGHERRVFSP